MAALPHLDADAVRTALDWPAAIDAIATAVAEVDLAASVPRTVVPIARGELMMMPAETASRSG